MFNFLINSAIYLLVDVKGMKIPGYVFLRQNLGEFCSFHLGSTHLNLLTLYINSSGI